MRWVPLSRRLAVQIGAAALVPMSPLPLFKYRITEPVEKFFPRLSGL